MGPDAFPGVPQIIVQAAQGLGLELTAEAYTAMASLPEAHIAELLQSVATKVAKGSLNNPSNYICAAIKRGYQSNDTWNQLKATGMGDYNQATGVTDYYQASGMAPTAYPGPAAIGVPHMSEISWGEESTEEGNLALQLAMQNATVGGVLLTQEAANSLMSVPSQMAASILDYVAQKHHELRDPSNYIIATVAKKVQDKGKGKGGGSTSAAYSSGGGGGGGKGKSRAAMIPNDISAVELKCVEVNAEGLWGEQQLDLNTLMSLRCLSQDVALNMLEQFVGKGRGKGGGIANINNYLQAGIAQIQKGDMSGYNASNLPPAIEDAAAAIEANAGYSGGAGGNSDFEPDAKRSRWH